MVDNFRDYVECYRNERTGLLDYSLTNLKCMWEGKLRAAYMQDTFMCAANRLHMLGLAPTNFNVDKETSHLKPEDVSDGRWRAGLRRILREGHYAKGF